MNIIKAFIRNWLQPRKSLKRLTKDFNDLWKAHKDILEKNKAIQSENKFLKEKIDIQRAENQKLKEPDKSNYPFF